MIRFWKVCLLFCICFVGVGFSKSTPLRFVDKTITIVQGTSKQLQTNSKGQPLQWRSTNIAIVSVNSSGKITGKAPGIAKVTVLNKNSQQKAQITVTVKKKMLSVKENYSKNADNIVTIEVYNPKDKLIALGSGFVIAPNRVATNFHVIHDEEETIEYVTVSFRDGTSYRTSTIVAADLFNDIAILDVAEMQSDSVATMNSRSVLEHGDEVIVIGNPLGLNDNLTNGIISNPMRYLGGVPFIGISAPISPGNSGGPVIDVYGDVIGIASAGFDEGQNLNLALPIGMVEQLRHSIGRRLSEYFKQPKQEDVVPITNSTSEKLVDDEMQFYMPINHRSSTIIGSIYGDYDTDEYRFAVNDLAKLELSMANEDVLFYILGEKDVVPTLPKWDEETKRYRITRTLEKGSYQLFIVA
ncbi:MAG: trypsin-like peptidase domain-containing protein, partial [Bacilli bacterium]